jgi:hypothetical protein
MEAFEGDGADLNNPDIDHLRQEWKSLYSETLPQMARSRDPAQTKWPVTLDHCFARIILDNVIGKCQTQCKYLSRTTRMTSDAPRSFATDPSGFAGVLRSLKASCLLGAALF